MQKRRKVFAKGQEKQQTHSEPTNLLKFNMFIETFDVYNSTKAHIKQNRNIFGCNITYKCVMD